MDAPLDVPGFALLERGERPRDRFLRRGEIVLADGDLGHDAHSARHRAGLVKLRGRLHKLYRKMPGFGPLSHSELAFGLRMQHRTGYLKGHPALVQSGA
ncbi:MAG TPA: hypothetical protein VGF59_24985 [Bryobacteraceae bacterium]